MTKRESLCFAFFAMVVALAVTPLFSQAFYGSVVGAVTDQSGGALPGATVTLTNAGTGERRQAQSSSVGAYQFLNLVPGTYRVQVEQSGFKRAARENVEVNVSGAVRADIAMELGDVTQTVEVEAAAPLLQTENANLSQVVNGRAIQDLPSNGRNIMNLIALTPGVVAQGSTDGNALTGKNIFAAGNYQMGGGLANQGAVYYDGVPNNSVLGNLVNMVPSPEAVQEFRVQTNSANSEYGRYGGGVVSMSSKSGTNEFHGSAYEYFRNTVLNANGFFANANNTGKLPFKQNQYGATFGGPIQKNKLFFFGSWEGYRSREGANFLATVPLTEMYGGDFSNYRNASGAVIPIYDPLTQCGTGSNPACTSDVVQRQQFPGNRIPANRINPVSAKLFAFPLMAAPNQPGQAFTRLNNFSTAAVRGGNNDQYNFRGDYNLGEKMRFFGRYSRWNSQSLPFSPYKNGIYANDPYAPEHFKTTQGVGGWTWVVTPTVVFDLRGSYNRFPYGRLQSFQGISLSKTFGFPTYMDDQIPVIHGAAGYISIPSVGVAGYTGASGLHIESTENTYVLAPNVSWVKGRHTMKFGADLRLMQNTYYQTFDGGSLNFTQAITSRNALNVGGTGNAMASALLGFGSAGNVTAFAQPYQSLRYQGFYVQDTWQATNKLTVSAGLRWEIPGVWRERYNRIASFNGNELNPVTKAITVNGQPVMGALNFVQTAQHPEKGVRTEHYNLFAPRLGLAYRLNDKTVIRTGAGIYYLPVNLRFSDAPWAMPLSQFNTPWLATLDDGVTPNDPISNPYPNGFISAPGNLPRDQAQALLVGGSLGNIPVRTIPSAYQSQWNFAIQRQLWGGVALEAAYAGNAGVHLPLAGQIQLNAISAKQLSLGSDLNTLVPNPFFGLVKVGALAQPRVQRGQLLRPYPQYTSVAPGGGWDGQSTYHALQMKVEKRYSSNGTVVAAYTFSKLLGNVRSLTEWLDSGLGAAPGPQDPANLRSEKSLNGFDSRSRLTVGYSVDLPFGKGHQFLNGGHVAVQKVTSGWSLSGTSTFQGGYPLAFTATPNNASTFGLGLRPNVAPGCDPKLSGSAQSRLLRWFNTSCLTVPAGYTLGNLSPTHPSLRGHGIANYNIALQKRTTITERVNLEFRGEFYNLFNRVQFALPDTTVTTNANPTTGQITRQINDPRQIQLALRLVF